MSKKYNLKAFKTFFTVLFGMETDFMKTFENFYFVCPVFVLVINLITQLTSRDCYNR